MLLVACGPQEESQSQFAPYMNWRPVPARTYATIGDANAPTGAVLKSQGYELAGVDGQHRACGPSCDGHWLYAYFLRKSIGEGASNDVLYTCPNPNTKPFGGLHDTDWIKSDDWKCSKDLKAKPDARID